MVLKVLYDQVGHRLIRAPSVFEEHEHLGQARAHLIFVKEIRESSPADICYRRGHQRYGNGDAERSDVVKYDDEQLRRAPMDENLKMQLGVYQVLPQKHLRRESTGIRVKQYASLFELQ